MSVEAIGYARQHLDALVAWADHIMNGDRSYDLQYLAEDLLSQLEDLSQDLSTVDDGRPFLGRRTVLDVGGRNYGPGGERR